MQARALQSQSRLSVRLLNACFIPEIFCQTHASPSKPPNSNRYSLVAPSKKFSYRKEQIANRKSTKSFSTSLRGTAYRCVHCS